MYNVQYITLIFLNTFNIESTDYEVIFHVYQSLEMSGDFEHIKRRAMSSFHSNTFRSNTFHSDTFHSNTFQSNTFYSNTFHSNTFHSNTFHSDTFRSIPFHSNTFHSITLHCIPFHYISIHSIIFQYTPFHSNTMHTTNTFPLNDYYERTNRGIETRIRFSKTGKILQRLFIIQHVLFYLF